MSEPITYASAGVDVEAGDRAVELMKASVRRATRPEVLGGLGGFAGMFDACALARMTRPVLATSTDGVGTKVAIAQALDRHDTIGFDLVGMVVDDIVVCGAEPLFMTDYIATGRVVPERIAAIVSGIAAACEQARVALVGGETAEHPGLLEPDEYDVAGPPPGSSSTPTCWVPQRVAPGDVVLALGSQRPALQRLLPGAQGRRAAGWALDRHVDEFGRTLGEELLDPDPRLLRRPARPDPHRRRRRARPLARHRRRPRGQPRPRPAAEGASPGSTARPGPRRRSSPPSAALGRVPRADLERTLNMGVGFVAMLPAEQVDVAMRTWRPAAYRRGSSAR